MSKLNILAIVLVGLLIFAEGTGLIYFVNKSQRLSGRLGNLEPKYEKLDKERAELASKHTSLRKEFDDIKAEHDAMKQDRNNLLTQAKSLLADSGKAKELAEVLKNMETEKAALQEEVGSLEKRNVELEGELEDLQARQAELSVRMEDVESAYEKARKFDIIKQLRKEIASLKEEKESIEKNLSEDQIKLQQLAEQKAISEAEKETVLDQLKQSQVEFSETKIQYEEDYADAIEKNKMLEEKLRDMPKRFAEIAHQNKKLMEETSQMHYNLGVFYTKNKEYKRAVKEFKKAEEIDPSDAYTHFNLGYIYAEYLVDRDKAIEHFRHFLRLAKADDRDTEWVRRYLLTWETYKGKKPLK